MLAVLAGGCGSTVLLVALGAGCGGTHRPAMRRLPSGAMPFLSIEHVSSMSATFELIALHVSVDGREVAALDGDEPLAARLCVSRGLASPGDHEIRVRARYRGHGFGVFSYLGNYRFDTTAATRVDVPEDAYGLAVRSEGYEGGGATAPLEDRPRLRFTARAERASPAGGCAPTAVGRAAAP